MSKARITYRFDRDTGNPAVEDTASHPVVRQEQQATGKIIPLYQEDIGFGARDYGAWKSPFDEETDRIEMLIRGAEAEPRTVRAVREVEQQRPLYYTSDDADDTFQRIPFYEEPAPTAPVTYRRAKKRMNWFGMTSSVAGAILTGVVLGMFVLSIFRGDPAAEGNSAADSELPPLTAEVEELEAADADSAVTDDPAAANDLPSLVGVADVQLAEHTYYLVQNGVFSSSEGAELAADQLKEKGLAGAVESGDKLSVFAGAATERDDALLISHHLQNEGLEVYIKPYVLPAVTQLSWSQDGSDALQDYLALSRKLIDEIISVSLQHLNEATPTVIAEEQMKAIKADHQQWTAAANTVISEAPEQMKPLLQGMNTSINSAVVTMEQYNKKPSSVYMWQIQTSATEHVIGQKKLLDQTT